MTMDRCYILLALASIILLSDCKRYEVQLDPKFLFGWEVDPQNKSISLDACVETEGYVGIGISTKGKMDEADMAMGGVKSSGEAYSKAYHGKHHKPVPDERQNWILLEASENSTHTFVKYSRLLDTGDSENVPITDDVTHIIWAIGKTDVIKKHHGHGKYAVNLINPPTTKSYAYTFPPPVSETDDNSRQNFGKVIRSYAHVFLTLYNLF